MTRDNLPENESDDNFEIPINNITEFLAQIAEMRENFPDEGDGQRFIFRGVKNCEYDVTPSIFRENLLSEEAKMGHLAYAKRPFEFREYDSAFERLTKLQHYGLCTRLLDVTFNPLVALYFACENCRKSNGDITDKSENEDDQNIDGVIYWRRGYCLLHDSTEVKILSAIAEMEFDIKITLKSCFDKLIELNVIPKDEIPKYEMNNYQMFVKVLQSNYFVIPNFSNERLIYQSGAFLLSGCIYINENSDDIGKSTIQKAVNNLRSEFDPFRFIISGNYKEKILDELDMYNINKSSLFPELEHQMDYIKSQSRKYLRPSAVLFSKVEWTSEEAEEENKPEKSPTETITVIEKDETDESVIRSSVERWTPPGISSEPVFDIFIKNKVVDWYKREQIISKIRAEVNRSIDDSMRYTTDGSRKWSNVIVNMVISEFKEYLQRKEEKDKSQ